MVLAVFFIISVIFIVVLLVGLYQKSTNAICMSKKRLDGRTVIVTGGTTGMGLEIAKDFADRGARVIIACPYENEGAEAKKIIENETGNNKIIFKYLDLASFVSIRKFAAEIIGSEKRLDILMNNAGLGASTEITEDGMNMVMQVNYFGQFLLTLLLLPLLKKTGTREEPARIVNTSSVLHYAGTVNLPNITLPKIALLAYPNSKLCVVLFTHELTKRMGHCKVVVNCVDPGAVGTGIFFKLGLVLGIFLKFACLFFFKSPWQGAQTAIHVALDNKAGTVSGEMFKNCKQTRAKRVAYDDKLAVQLWEESVLLVGLDAEELKQCLA